MITLKIDHVGEINSGAFGRGDFAKSHGEDFETLPYKTNLLTTSRF
jgi:hypothetical protein